jgi:hypothetical protein
MMDECSVCGPEERAICLCRYPDFAHFRTLIRSAVKSERDYVRLRSRLGYTPPPGQPHIFTPRVAFPSSPPIADRPPRQVVVTAYAEDLDWIRLLPVPCVVYHHGLGAVPEGVPYVRLRNVGREAHGYLTHIVTRYDELADVTVFCQGNPFDHAPDFHARCTAHAGLTSLTVRYTAVIPDVRIKALDRVEWVDGYEVHYGLADADRRDATRPRDPWLNPAVWPHVFETAPPSPWWFGYGATWNVPRENIVARPREFWAWLLAEVEASGNGASSWTDPPVNPWSIEALWLYLFSDPREYPQRRDRVAEIRPPTAQSEVALLRGMTCCYQRLCGCPSAQTAGYDCTILGSRVSPATCAVCFYGLDPKRLLEQSSATSAAEF